MKVLNSTSMKSLKSFLFCLLLSFLIFNDLSAHIELSPLFTDNMVLQQQSNVPIWGKTSPYGKVRIVTSWNNQSYETVAGSDGSWSTKINTPQAGGPYNISISDNTEIILNNVLIGEVWLCSGQSNMEMPVGDWGKVLNYEKEIANANYPSIRLLHVDKTISYSANAELQVSSGGWQECSPSTIGTFSAVAYFFGRNLFQNVNVPIGLINASWSGTVIEAWINEKALKEVPYLEEDPQWLGTLYNGMIKPIIPFNIAGTIWYQGESNAWAYHLYYPLFSTLISDWRKQWGYDFPFYYVQLANYISEPQIQWAGLREAQLQALQIPNTGMAVAIDLGEKFNIHPSNKQDVGARLALIARAKTYGEDIPYSGPIYASSQIENGKVKISFNYVEDGLVTKNNQPLQGFEISGDDNCFYNADASIDGDKVIVSSLYVPEPKYVRYAWSNTPTCNLYNTANLPASPFRTETNRSNDINPCQKGMVKYFPNPVADFVSIECENGISEIQILNLSGKYIKSYQSSAPVTQEELSLSDLDKGIYIMYVKDISGEMYQTKIIKK